ncbi:ArsR/SmtB family transcription factor [Allorhizobium undicola]|uniref:ArsR/SmtB family transcription factor n=1 Tax=Allorhizobium undicola TaxID=78527 RepID=UPI000481EAA4|nr:metalloregulator ArsR/SmtB family transcription factor [Allorhizobium undicola]
MDDKSTINSLAALAQPTRLQLFRLLAAEEPQGISAGDLARRLNVPQNTMSAHLSAMSQAALIYGTRHGRSIVYRADLGALRAVILYLLQDCCGGRPDLCLPLLSELQACCASREC